MEEVYDTDQSDAYCAMTLGVIAEDRPDEAVRTPFYHGICTLFIAMLRPVSGTLVRS